MAARRKKIGLIFASASTISFPMAEETSIKDAADIDRWLKLIPELNIIADIEPIFVTNCHSSEINPPLWKKIAEIIYQKKDDCDGFIITHGADTVLYTSAAVAFMLPNFSKTIIFTGSIEWPLPYVENIPTKEYLDIGIKSNLINATQVATMDLAENCLMFGNQIIRSTRAYKEKISALNIFQALSNGLIGQIDFNISLALDFKPKNNNQSKFYPEINSNIQIIELSPHTQTNNCQKIAANAAGVIIKNYSSGHLNSTIEELVIGLPQEIPIVIYNQDLSAKNLETHTTLPPNTMVVTDLALEVAAIKLMHLLGKTNDPTEIKKLMRENFAGELG